MAVGVMVRDPDGLTVCGPDNPDPAKGDAVMTRLVAFVEVHDRVVVWPSSMSVGFAVSVAVGMAVVFTVS